MIEFKKIYILIIKNLYNLNVYLIIKVFQILYSIYIIFKN